MSGKPLFYAVHPSRDPGALPVVLIHGAGGSHLSWPVALRRLSPAASSYLPDLPGHGRSADGGFDSVEGFADTILQFCELLNLREVALIGHSMGGAVALTLALRQPALCRSLVLLNSAAKFDVPRAILDALDEDQERAVELICQHAFAPDFPAPWLDAACQILRELPLTTLRDDYRACQGFDVTEQLCDVRTPTLIIGATDDVLTPPQDQYLLAERIPGARFFLIQNAGHMAMLTHAEQVRAEVLSFLPLTK